MNKWASIAIALILTNTVSTNSFAATDCSALLHPDVYNFQKNIQTRLTYLHQINRESYRVLRSSDYQELEISVFDVIGGDGSGTYEEFDEARNSYLEKMGYDRNYQDA